VVYVTLNERSGHAEGGNRMGILRTIDLITGETATEVAGCGLHEDCPFGPPAVWSEAGTDHVYWSGLGIHPIYSREDAGVPPPARASVYSYSSATGRIVRGYVGLISSYHPAFNDTDHIGAIAASGSPQAPPTVSKAGAYFYTTHSEVYGWIRPWDNGAGVGRPYDWTTASPEKYFWGARPPVAVPHTGGVATPEGIHLCLSTATASVACLNATDGTVAWTASTSYATVARPVYSAAAGAVVFIGGGDGNVTGLDLWTGARKFSFYHSKEYDVEAGPVFSDDGTVLFFSSIYGRMFALRVAPEADVVVRTSGPAPNGPSETPTPAAAPTAKEAVVVRTSGPSPNGPSEAPTPAAAPTAKEEVVVRTSGPALNSPSEAPTLATAPNATATHAPDGQWKVTLGPLTIVLDLERDSLLASSLRSRLLDVRYIENATARHLELVLGGLYDGFVDLNMTLGLLRTDLDDGAVGVVRNAGGTWGAPAPVPAYPYASRALRRSYVTMSFSGSATFYGIKPGGGEVEQALARWFRTGDTEDRGGAAGYIRALLGPLDSMDDTVGVRLIVVANLAASWAPRKEEVWGEIFSGEKDSVEKDVDVQEVDADESGGTTATDDTTRGNNGEQPFPDDDKAYRERDDDNAVYRTESPVFPLSTFLLWVSCFCIFVSGTIIVGVLLARRRNVSQRWRHSDVGTQPDPLHQLNRLENLSTILEGPEYMYDINSEISLSASNSNSASASASSASGATHGSMHSSTHSSTHRRQKFTSMLALSDFISHLPFPSAGGPAGLPRQESEDEEDKEDFLFEESVNSAIEGLGDMSVCSGSSGESSNSLLPFESFQQPIFAKGGGDR